MTSKLLIGCFFAAAAVAQTTGADGSFHFTTPQTPQSLQQAATLLRTVADIPQVSLDDSLSTITFHGPADKVAMAEWTLGELDRPGGETALHEYKMPAGEVARINFLANVQTTQGMQEVLTVLRTVADIAKVFNYTARQAIVLRGKEGDIAFAEWIVDQLNRPAQPEPDTAPREYTLATNGAEARVNYLANVTTPQGIQEILATLRIVGEIMKVFTYSPRRAIVLRGADPDIQRAEWLIQGLDQQPGQQTAGTHAFAAPAGDDVTRIFYLANAKPQGLKAAVTAVRSEAKVRRAFSTTTPATVVVRGTSDQVEAAAQIIAAGNGLALLRP